MYMDYGDSTPRTHNNLFDSLWKDIGLTAGAGLGGWGARKVGHDMGKKAVDLFQASEDIAGRSGLNMFGENDAKKAKLLADSKAGTARAKGVFKYGKKLTSVANVFGWATMVNMGMSLASSALRTGGAFKTTKEELARKNFNDSNDQSTYYDTRAAYTQRQRALQVIHNSRLSLKPMLGAESNYLHY